MNLTYIDRVAPHHEKTSCSDAQPNNGRYAATDLGGCYRCTLLTATVGEDIDTLAPEHEKTSCSDAHPVNGRYAADDLGGLLPLHAVGSRGHGGRLISSPKVAR